MGWLVVESALEADGGASTAELPACVSFADPQGSVGAKVLFNVANGLPTLAFLAFLTWRLKPSLRRLVRSQSQIMTTYYAFLWVVCLLNLFRVTFQIAESTDRNEKLWNFMWILTMAGMTTMEVSVVTFLSQGYVATGREALARTLCISGAVALFDCLVKVILVYGYRIPLFLFAEGAADPLQADMTWAKWGFWTTHHLFYLVVYLLILVLPHTHLRDYLPARPSFYRYVACLCLCNMGLMIGAVMVGSKSVDGYCVYGFFTSLYFTLYPPLLYMTFLSEFFVDDDLELEAAYYR